MLRPLIAGNWKMNGLKSALSEIDVINEALSGMADKADCLLCPPATLIAQMAAQAGARLYIGGQSCHPAEKGAHTGDISADMLSDAGASYVIVGHSERRQDHNETDADIAAQTEAALRARLTPIICCGETLETRKAGSTLAFISAQLAASLPDSLQNKAFVVAYEPIWAIGTGEVATPEQIGEVHAHIRALLTDRFGETGTKTRILYGGSMKPGNAADILAVPHVNGGLIGGASLKAGDFMAIYAAAIS
ncbi:MAG: triose-phosphate isomerase [Pseudomonadota bacterium]